MQPLPGCDEARLFRDDGTYVHFTNPKVQASVNANTYYISGKAEEKKGSPNDFVDFPSFAAGGGDDEVPDLVPTFEK